MGLETTDSEVPLIGLMLPCEGLVSADGVVSVSRAVEEAGLYSVWVGDHVTFPVEMTSPNPTMKDGKYPYPMDNPRLEAFTTLAFVAGSTSTIKLGINACVIPYRNPVLLGKIVSTLDHLSGGRVVFGATLGWCREEFEVLGADFENRVQILEEGIGILRTLWEQDQPSYEGKAFRFPSIHIKPKPQQSPMPILMGGQSKPALRRAAAIGDGWLGIRLSPEELKDHVKFLREERKKSSRASYPFTVSVNCPVTLEGEGADGLNLFNTGEVIDFFEKLSEAGADLVHVVVTSHEPEDLLTAIGLLEPICKEKQS